MSKLHAKLFLRTFLTLFALPFATNAQRARAPQEGGGRIAPPAAITCSRDHLTSYNGKIIYYRRTSSRTVLRVRTDWDTTEQVTLRHGRNKNPQRWFLLRGDAFMQEDWAKIETSRGRLRPDVRANVWVCDDGRNPVVDWQPPQAD